MRWVIGVDEVGRGALAGPVVVVAAAMPANSRKGLKDSKQLSPAQREHWAKKFRSDPEITFAVARYTPAPLSV